LVVCELEGRTIKEAAGSLGWPQGTVATRLARGRALLARRLSRRGLALGGMLSAATASASVSPALVSLTVKAAATGAGISAEVAALTEGVLRAMLLTKMKVATAYAVAVCVLGLTVAWAAQPAATKQAAIQTAK